jgi:hypothetical protein
MSKLLFHGTLLKLLTAVNLTNYFLIVCLISRLYDSRRLE